MKSTEDMGGFWDERAREDALFYVDDRGLRGDEFWADGPEIVARFESELGFSATGETVVEIGCGVGRLTRVLGQRAKKVYALDVSGEMLARAREHNPQLANVEWILGDGTSLSPVPDGAADAVFSHVVFQHIPDPAITLGYVAEMGRVLRPGGWAAFQVSNDPGIHRPKLLSRGTSRHPAWRGSAVGLDALRGTAAEAGLSVEAVVGEGTQFCLVRLSRQA